MFTLSVLYEGPCDNAPCENEGTCTGLEDGDYQCLCAEGFTGDNCQTGKNITLIGFYMNHILTSELVEDRNVITWVNKEGRKLYIY